VFTTGATLRAAAAVLRTAGATHVSALTLARVDRAISTRTALKSAAAAWGAAPSVLGPKDPSPIPASRADAGPFL
jgi:hypothetical protein